MNKVKELLAKLKQKVLELVEKIKVVLGLKEKDQDVTQQLADLGTYTYTVSLVSEPKEDDHCYDGDCPKCEDNLDFVLESQKQSEFKKKPKKKSLNKKKPKKSNKKKK